MLPPSSPLANADYDFIVNDIDFLSSGAKAEAGAPATGEPAGDDAIPF